MRMLVLLPCVWLLACKGSPQTLPLIVDVQPAFGPGGSDVELVVEGLRKRSDVSVTLAGDPVDLLDFDHETGTVRARIPESATSGRLVITVDEVQSNPAAFMVSDVFVRPVTDADFLVVEKGYEPATIYPNNQVVALFSEPSADEVRKRLEGAEVLGAPVELWGFVPDLGLAQVGVAGVKDDVVDDLQALLPGLGAETVVPNLVLENQSYWIGARDVEGLSAADAAPYALIDVEGAWDYLDDRIGAGLQLEKVTVGIREQSIDRSHVELSAFFDPSADVNPTAAGLSVWSGDKCTRGAVCSHGTQVTSLVAGLNNGRGATGVLTGVHHEDAWVVVHGIASPANDPTQVLFQDVVAQAQLVKLGADVINVSFGLTAASTADPKASGGTHFPDADLPALISVYRRLFAASPDVLFVTAAGNDGIDANLSIPNAATADNMLSVAAVDGSGAPVWWSNWGSTVELASPGVSLLMPDPQTGVQAYTHEDGTSFSAPLVAGAAGLAKAIDPTLTGAQLKRLLVGTGSRLPSNEIAPRPGAKKVPGPRQALTTSGRVLDVSALVQAVDKRLEVDEGDVVEDGSVNGVVAGPDFGKSGGPLIFNLSLTSLDGQPIQEQLQPSDFTFEDVTMELISAPGSLGIDVRSAQVTSIDYQVADGDDASVAVLLDQSCSMLTNDPADLRVEAASVLVDAVLDQQPDDDRVALATFPRLLGLGDLPSTDVWQTFTDDNEALTGDLDSLRSYEGGGTPLYSSIIEYVDLVETELGKTPTSRAMVVMTDGQDGSVVSWEDARDAALAGGIPLYIVGLGSSVDFGTLQDLAVSTGGTFVPARSPEQLAQLFANFGQAVYGSVNLSAQFELVAASPLRQNSFYRVRGRLVYGAESGPLVIPFDFELFIGNLSA